jgi:short-subunit dehydrogenase
MSSSARVQPSRLPRVLITGASSGIGEGFARVFAARREDLVLVARSAERLGALAAELSAQYGVHVDVIPADLAQAEAVDAIVDELRRRDITIGTLINNAGFGTHGLFATLDAALERDEITVNAGAVVALTRAFLPGMLTRRAGAILNVASTAGFQPVPYMATYAATKAFVLAFTEALAEEVRGTGVRVVVLCPGQTKTAFFTGIEDARTGRARTVEQVVATGLRALERGRTVAIDGPANALLAAVARLSPRRISTRVAGAMMRPKRRGAR